MILININKLLSNTVFASIDLNTVNEVRSYYIEAMAISKKQLMIILDIAGVSIINWNELLKFIDSPDSEYNELSFIKLEASCAIIAICDMNETIKIDLSSLNV